MIEWRRKTVTNYVYFHSNDNPETYTVGFYTPDGEWVADSNHGDIDEAKDQVNYLNGGDDGCDCFWWFILFFIAGGGIACCT